MSIWGWGMLLMCQVFQVWIMMKFCRIGPNNTSKRHIARWGSQLLTAKLDRCINSHQEAYLGTRSEFAGRCLSFWRIQVPRPTVWRPKFNPGVYPYNHTKSKNRGEWRVEQEQWLMASLLFTYPWASYCCSSCTQSSRKWHEESAEEGSWRISSIQLRCFSFHGHIKSKEFPSSLQLQIHQAPFHFQSRDSLHYIVT